MAQLDEWHTDLDAAGFQPMVDGFWEAMMQARSHLLPPCCSPRPLSRPCWACLLIEKSTQCGQCGPADRKESLEPVAPG